MRPRVGALLVLIGLTAAPTGPGSANDPALQGLFDRITSQGPAQRAEWSALAVSLATGDTLFSSNADRPLAPASNMKLLTTAAALHTLGPDFRYQTFAITTRAPENGTVEGDLVLYGTGDPALSDRFSRGGPDPLEVLADAVRDAGVRQVLGDLVADGSFLNGSGRFEEWLADDLDDWYAAPVAGLSYHENLVTLRTSPAVSPGLPPVVEVLPSLGRQQIENEAHTRPGTGRPDLVVTRTEPDGPIRVIGSISSSQRPIWKRMTVTDPSQFTGEAFKTLLEERNVFVSGRVVVVHHPAESPLMESGRAPGTPAGQGSLHTIATYESPPLRAYLDVINRESHNFFAETVFKTMGRIMTGDGTYLGGRRAVEEFLRGSAGVAVDQVLQRDGSGLSPNNQMSAGAFVDLLTWVYHSPHREDFEATLPTAGTRRGLGRMYRTPAAGNLRAKTGTIESVSALSGFVASADGEPIAFSLISNGIRSSSYAKSLEDRLGAALAGWRRNPDARPLLNAWGPVSPAPPDPLY